MVIDWRRLSDRGPGGNLVGYSTVCGARDWVLAAPSADVKFQLLDISRGDRARRGLRFAGGSSEIVCGFNCSVTIGTFATASRKCARRVALESRPPVSELILWPTRSARTSCSKIGRAAGRERMGT